MGKQVVLSKHILIPPNVLRDFTLPPDARLLYGIIYTHSLATGYCLYTNQEFGDMLNLSAKRISALVSELSRHNYLNREVIRSQKTNEVMERRLYPLGGETVEVSHGAGSNHYQEKEAK